MKKALLTLAIVTVAAFGARAQVAAWDVSGHGSPADTTLNASTVDGSLISNTPSLSRTTVTGSAAANSFSSAGWNTTDTRNDSSNYISFSLTAAQAITLTDLQFAMNGSNTGPRNGVWGYSINGGAFTLGTAGDGGAFTLANPAPSALADWNFSDVSVAAGQNVEFRFWAFGTQGINANNTTASASTGTVRIANISGNDLVLNGFALVPEPTTIALVGLGLAGVVAFARRRKA